MPTLISVEGDGHCCHMGHRQTGNQPVLLLRKNEKP